MPLDFPILHLNIMDSERFNRHLPLFGKEGQDKIRAAHVVIVGVGGLGTHAVQQLALLGVGHLTLIDGEELDHTNKNRYIGAWHDDPVPGTKKVDIGERLIRAIDQTITVRKVHDSFISERGFDAISNAGTVFGCLDNYGPRFILNELCLAYGVPLFDLASGIIPGDAAEYGGRMTFVNGEGCLVCHGCLDMDEVRDYLMTSEARDDRAQIYGVDAALLGDGGPSVVSINGVIASLAVSEYMAFVTGLRAPQRGLNYRGHLGKVTLVGRGRSDCYYCGSVRGQRQRANVRRYLITPK